MGERAPEVTPHPVDLHVGARLRLRRQLLGMSQQKLGAAVNLTFQQVRKYELGANRISASTLHRLAGALEVPITWFFEGIDGEGERSALAAEAQLSQEIPGLERQTIELMRAYARILEPTAKRRLLDLALAIADMDGDVALVADRSVSRLERLAARQRLAAPRA